MELLPEVPAARSAVCHWCSDSVDQRAVVSRGQSSAWEISRAVWLNPPCLAAVLGGARYQNSTGWELLGFSCAGSGGLGSDAQRLHTSQPSPAKVVRLDAPPSTKFLQSLNKAGLLAAVWLSLSKYLIAIEENP